MLPRDIGALAVWLRDLRKQFPDRPIVAFADNFHHYDCRQGGPSEGEGKVQYLARYAKDLAIRHHATLIMTMELPMWALKPGVRPRISTLKGSTAMAYEASANIGVYNDLKDFGSKSMLVWEDKNELEEYELPDGTKQKRPVKKPVIELVFDKSKIFKGFDGTTTIWTLEAGVIKSARPGRRHATSGWRGPEPTACAPLRIPTTTWRGFCLAPGRGGPSETRAARPPAQPQCTRN